MGTEHEHAEQRADEAGGHPYVAVEKWGDAQQYRAEPHSSYAGPQSGVMPEVTLLWMTPDPLGAIAAMAAMYEGRVVRDLSELSHEDRVHYWHEMRKTKLNTPFESVVFHFLLEGVDRSFTHQAVRKRTGTAFAQESLRFAVVGDLKRGTTLPPSLQGTEVPGHRMVNSQAENWRADWDMALGEVQRAYHRLVSSGMPAEEARGLLPESTATRMHYVVNLRSLLEEAGNRLCTQAQFHWKMVMSQIVWQIRNWPNVTSCPVWPGIADEFALLADAFRPVCYQEGRCPFKAGFDRDCSIRHRVDVFASMGIKSDRWGDQEYLDNCGERAIRPEEWLMNPGAARRRS